VYYIISYHAILEALKARTAKGALYVIDDLRRQGPRIREIVEEAARCGTTVIPVPKNRLDSMAQDHRGAVLALESDFAGTMSLETLCERVLEHKSSLVVVLDHIEDPQNLGAILRSADVFGIDAYILPARRASPLTDAAVRSSAGAIAWVPIIQVPNLKAAVEMLKEAGYWVYAADMQGKSVNTIHLSAQSLFILGNEGKGASRILKESADETISIPMLGHVDSLNVSASAAILMYEFRRSHPV
jgi:23S rRNA (guanosine2251-2'-O)-methyltransferase